MANNHSAWSRLRWPWKVLIVALPFLGFLYVGTEKDWFSNIGGNPKTESDLIVVDNRNNNSSASDASNTSTLPADRIFAYAAEKPVNGTLKGVVEVGSTGFNSFVINMDPQKRWEIRSKDFGSSLVYEGLATVEDIRDGLKKYITGMLDKGVKARDIHFVISSGAQKEPKTKIISTELRKMGYVVNQVTPEQEGTLALRSVLPASYRSTAFVTDIGSGNTKISWMNGNNITAVEAPGSKYYEKDMKDENVYAEVKNKASRIPEANREICFLLGGVAFELANEHRKGEERYTVLRAPDAYNSDKPKTKAGLNIYKALVDATGCDTFVFDWDANFTIGFLLNF